MNRLSLFTIAVMTSFCLGFSLNSILRKDQITSAKNSNLPDMKLGAFSVSLSVKDLSKSKEFYEKLGFSVFGGDLKNNYLIMKNESTLIGLFQGMFEDNILTFNPGWDENAEEVEGYQDVRTIQQYLKSTGEIIINPADENSTGPASFMIKDPDGNMILFDQHL